VIGRGANILFTQDFPGLVIHVAIKGIDIIEQNQQQITLQLGAGEDWPELVTYAVNQGWAGIENLAGIPGLVGAAPIQNIGAYGQQLADVFVSLQAVNRQTGELKTFSKADCQFQYRDSIFKHELKDAYVITSVTLQLATDFSANTSYHSRYESLEDELQTFAQPPYSLGDIHRAIIQIRQKKLPQIEEVGTVGSTFKNPFITQTQLSELQKKTPNVQYYPVEGMAYPKDLQKLEDQEYVKVAAGWLIEEMGWRGKRVGNVGISDKHALCVVAYDDASPAEVYAFTEQLRQAFQDYYGFQLKYEVNVL
jgi:UDP-N-acetylmuramate dehydrogenase